MPKAGLNILAFDTAMAGCSAAVLTGEGSCVSRLLQTQRGQAEQLVPMIDAVINESGIEYADLSAIVTTCGPGAFTGLRIGLSTARALGLALNVPVGTLTTLEILAGQFFDAHAIEPGQKLAVLLETKRRDFYMQIFSAAHTPLSDPEAIEGADAISRLRDGDVVIGDVNERFRQFAGDLLPAVRFIDGYSLPAPCRMAMMARDLVEANGIEALRGVEPLYLRNADVSMSKKNFRSVDDLSALEK